MRVLIASGRPHIPQASGGVPSTTHDVALGLKALGHEVEVLAGLRRDDLLGLFARAHGKLGRVRGHEDSIPGYKVYRHNKPRESIATVVAKTKPDVAIIQMGGIVPMADSFLSLGVPVVIYFHNVDFDDLNGRPANRPGLKYVANSDFTSRRYKEEFGVDSVVIPPPLTAELYIAPNQGRNVTFINPHPVKGGDIAFAIAERCPDIPFEIYRSWVLDDKILAEVQAKAAGLPNVVLHPSAANMKKVYSQAKILLAPSRCEEAWGRVVSEAQINGIPVIASDRGGLPQSVGPGGILLDPDGPIDAWVAAVRRLWDDPVAYGDLSAAALEHAQREELSTQWQLDQLLGVISESQKELARHFIATGNLNSETAPRIAP